MTETTTKGNDILPIYRLLQVKSAGLSCLCA